MGLLNRTLKSIRAVLFAGKLLIRRRDVVRTVLASYKGLAASKNTAPRPPPDADDGFDYAIVRRAGVPRGAGLAIVQK